MNWTRRVAVAVFATVLVGALGACAVPPSLDPGQLAACRVERDVIETALEAGFASSGVFPPSIEAMQEDLDLLEPGSLKLDWDYTTDGVSYTLEGLC